jgi:hypothetical protein
VLLGRTRKRVTRCDEASTEVQAPTAKSPPASPGPSEELQRYRRGEITEAEYLEGRIEAATKHLCGKVSPERLKLLKEVMIRKLETDPLLVELRRRLLDADGSGRKVRTD